MRKHMDQTALSSDRHHTILDAAFHAFATYGFRRTSMDDIARSSGLSRTALYLYYRNKEDIFRTLTARHFETSVSDMSLALAKPNQRAETTLHAAFLAKDGIVMDVVLGTPHGDELLDASFSIAADLVAKGEARMTAVLTAWLAGREIPSGLGTAQEIAQTTVAALKGLKHSAQSLGEYRSGQAVLARVIGRALG